MTDQKYLKVIELLTDKVEALEHDKQITSWQVAYLEEKLAKLEEAATPDKETSAIHKAVNATNKEVR